MKLQNKVAVITGGAMGNGLGITKVFLKEGARVAILDYDDKLEDTVINLKQAGYEVSGYKADIRDMKRVSECLKAINEK